MYRPSESMYAGSIRIDCSQVRAMLLDGVSHKTVPLRNEYDRLSWYLHYPNGDDKGCHLRNENGVFHGRCFIRGNILPLLRVENDIEGLYKVCMRWEENEPGVCKDVIVNNYRKGRMYMEVLGEECMSRLDPIGQEHVQPRRNGSRFSPCLYVGWKRIGQSSCLLLIRH